jgi:hypothetical protein
MPRIYARHVLLWLFFFFTRDVYIVTGFHFNSFYNFKKPKWMIQNGLLMCLLVKFFQMCFIIYKNLLAFACLEFKEGAHLTKHELLEEICWKLNRIVIISLMWLQWKNSAIAFDGLVRWFCCLRYVSITTLTRFGYDLNFDIVGCWLLLFDSPSNFIPVWLGVRCCH